VAGERLSRRRDGTGTAPYELTAQMAAPRERLDRFRRTATGRAAVLVALVTLSTALVGGGLAIFGVRVNVGAVALIIFMVIVIEQAVAALLQDEVQSPADGANAPSESELADAFGSYNVLRFEVRSSLGDAEQFARLLAPTVVELADDRLLRGHGITRIEQPEKARSLLGEQLWSITSGEFIAAQLQIGDFEQLIDKLESL
jgi:hypothetical protein